MRSLFLEKIGFQMVLDEVRSSGFRAAFKKYRWKLLAMVVAYYTVRDLTLYILIPYLVWRFL